MGLNYDISMKILNENDEAIKDVKVHAYFNKVNDNSSDSTWNSDIQKTTGTGKCSFNLGDDSFLTSNGKIDNGDTILITAWLTDNSDVSNDDKSSKENNTITRCVNFIHIVNTDESSYEEKIILLQVKNPICDFNIPSVTHTGHEFTIENNSYITNGAYSVDTDEVKRDDLYQDTVHYNQDLFLGLEIQKTNYDLGEVNEDKENITDYVYSYVDSGDYDTTFTVYNYLGVYCITQKSFHILYNKPNIALDYEFTKKLNSDKHIGIGNDDEMKTTQLSSCNYGDTWSQLKAKFNWYIKDKNIDGTDNNSEYKEKDETFEPTKYFNTSSSDNEKELKMEIEWNDGFDDHIETLTLNPYLDVYNIRPVFSWITQKEYFDDVYIPLGDDDKMTVEHHNEDIASEDYDSNSQWKKIIWSVTKNKNDGSDDSEILELNKDDDNYNTLFEFFVKYHHDSDNTAELKQQLTYWNGYEDISKELKYNFISEKYSITHTEYFETQRNGKGKKIINDDDEVSIINTSSFYPQNNLDIIKESKYLIDKDKYKNYDDDTIEEDNEEFSFDNFDDIPKFYVHKEQEFTSKNTILFYNGYEDETSEHTLYLESVIMTPLTGFIWSSKNGSNENIQGRDDTVTFENISKYKDFYDKEYSVDSPRCLSIDWSFSLPIIENNFKEIDKIGGDKFTSDEADEENKIILLDKDIDFKPEINFFSEGDKDITITFYYNNGYFNVSDTMTSSVSVIPYDIPEIICNYTDIINDRHEDVIFSDNTDTDRTINIDWKLTDKYQDTSMTIDKRGEDNLQIFEEQSAETEITTHINSFEEHTLYQKNRWDNGFKLVELSNDYLIKTNKYDIIPKFVYENVNITGPIIKFTNNSTINGKAVLLTYDLEILDKDNEDNNADKTYYDIDKNDSVQHTYKSCSNSPFEEDKYNKEVTIFQDFDDGWNEDYLTYTENILVQPNRIEQEFILEPLRHENDNTTENNIIIGNNPIKFYDDSAPSNGDNGTEFIKKVEYVISECE